MLKYDNFHRFKHVRKGKVFLLSRRLIIKGVATTSTEKIAKDNTWDYHDHIGKQEWKRHKEKRW